MPRFVPAAICVALIAGPVFARAESSTDPPLLEPGDLKAVAAGGPITIARDLTWDIEASFRVGLASGVELAAPLALAVRLIDISPGSAIFLGAGIVDLSFTEEGRVLWAPSAMLAGQARLGPESAFRAAFDITGAEEGFDGPDHPFWMRGSLAFLIDFGPYVTLAAGFAYQRRALGHGPPPDGVRRTGWVSDSRISLGAVRSQPFHDLPTLSIHMAGFFDIVFLMRFDIDMETETTDARYLVGLELKKL
jgi:hypothetical protein